MAKEHSFDITAEFDKQEMKNAIEQAKKEVANRYDFKGLKAEIDYNEKAKTITLISSSDSKVEAMSDIVISKIIKRGISSKAVNEFSRESVSGGNIKLILSIKDVLSKEDSKKIIKEIKSKKLKVNAQIQGDEIRVTSKSIDELRKCMKIVQDMDLEVPINFRNLK